MVISIGKLKISEMNISIIIVLVLYINSLTCNYWQREEAKLTSTVIPSGYGIRCFTIDPFGIIKQFNIFWISLDWV